MFLACKVSYYVWMIIYNWIGVYVVLLGDITTHFCQHSDLLKGSFSRFWRLIWFSTMWIIWLHWNEPIFKGGMLDFDKVFDLIRIIVSNWCNHSFKEGSVSFLDWCTNLVHCL